MPSPTLFIFSGLPGVGKTTLARLLARELHAAYLRIDTIEQALRSERLDPPDSPVPPGPEGYVVAYRLAADNLRLGTSVVADSVNPIALTRRAWRDVATLTGTSFVEIHVICSDVEEHRRRVESRVSDIPGHRSPTWHEVQTREFHPWDSAPLSPLPPLVIDTAARSEAESFKALQRGIPKRSAHSPSRQSGA